MSLHSASRGRQLVQLAVVALMSLAFRYSGPGDPLYMPRSIHRAFDRGTRSMDGRPGPNYWQNRARYTITLAASPPDRTIRGSEQITYFNNSPDSLRNIVMRLILNVRRPGAPRAGGAPPAYLNDGVQIDSFSINGVSRPWQNNGQYFTWQPVPLAQGQRVAVAPHDSVHLTFTWHYQLSTQAGREGMLDSTTYYLAYFYPRVSVYDDTDGWDTMDFTDAQEFYSDFNDYDVRVRVPSNYVVWGTGTLLNASEVLQPAIAQRLQQSFTSDDVMHIASLAEMKSHVVTQQNGTNVWHFRANDIPDVTFALSDHYVWDGASVVVDDASQRRASVQSAYNDTAADFRYMVKFGQHGLDWFSHNWPGVPYPYEKSTIVQGSADMEYPMMVNDGSNADTTFSKFVALHEIAHTYFPFYMGVNESRYAFMDEGWATTLEYLVNQVDMGPDKAENFFKQFRVSGWANAFTPLEDLPIITPEDALTAGAWGDNAYGKAALGYLAVKDLLGDAVFKSALHEYMDRWHGKHPLPWDFFNTFNNRTGKDLNWFWNNWYFTSGYIDYNIASVTQRRGGWNVVVNNVGGFYAPFDLNVTYTDGTSAVLHQTSALWMNGAKQQTIAIPTSHKIKSVKIDGGIWMDATPGNNEWTAK